MIVHLKFFFFCFCRRMENEAENPFRPEEQLFHEVDPIVEAYMKKPYPPRSTQTSPGATPVKSGNQAFVNGKLG